MARAQTPPRWTADTARLLTDLVRARLHRRPADPTPDPRMPAPSSAVAGLADAARWHRVAGVVLDALPRSEAAAVARVRDVLTAHVRGQRARHAAVIATLGALAPVLDRSGPWAVLKGPVLAAQQTDLGRRPAGDLDVLVDPSNLPERLAALAEAGWETAERNWRLLTRLPLGQVHLRPAGTAGRVAAELDLHWHVVHHPAARRRLDVPTAALLAARRDVDLGALRAPTLAPVDLAIHVALHAVLGGLGHLGWLVDLHRAVAVAGVTPATVLDRADDLEARLVTAVALARTADVLGDPRDHPGATGRMVGRRGWGAVVALTHPGSDAGRHPAGPRETVARAVASATRRDVRSSTTALVGGVMRTPLRGLTAVLRLRRLRRLAPLLRHAGRLFPGRALGLPRGDRDAFRPVRPPRRTPAGPRSRPPAPDGPDAEVWSGPLPDRDGLRLLRAASDEDVERGRAALARWWDGRDVHRVPGGRLEVAAVAGERVGDPPAVAAALRSWRRWAAARSLVAVDLADRLSELAARDGVRPIVRDDLATRLVAPLAPWRWTVRGVALTLPAGSGADARERARRLRDELLRVAADTPAVPVTIDITPGSAHEPSDPATHLRALVRRNWAHRPPGGLRWLLDAGATVDVLLADTAPDEAAARLLRAGRTLARDWERSALATTLSLLAALDGRQDGDAVTSLRRALDGPSARVAADVGRRVLTAAAAPPLSRLRRGAR